MSGLTAVKWPAAATLIGWLVLAGSVGLVSPLFGAASPVTWALIWLGWLGAILGPAWGAVWSARSRLVAPAAVWAVCATLAGSLLAVVGAPARTVDELYQRHRDDLDQVAADYRAGRIDDDRLLPWRLRILTEDGRAHPRCTSAEPAHGCGLFLLLWQDLRAEDGFGIAYFPVRPDQDVAIATAPGDVGVPVRELGRGWWLVD